jgi:hypothetical protein
VSPESGPTSGGNTVTITGTAFAPGATVRFGSTRSATVNIVSGTKLTAVAPGHTAGTVDIVVTTARGASTTSTADQYTY